MAEQTHPAFIYEAERAARASKAGTTLGEVAIARAGLAIADAILVLAKATDRGAAADEAFAAQSAARHQRPPRPIPAVVIQDAEVEDAQVMNLTSAETELVDLIRDVDEESGFNNIFTPEAVALAKAILEKYGKHAGIPVETQIQTAVAVERERIANAFADFFQYQNFGSWKSEEGRYFEDLGNGRKVGYHLAKDVIEGKAAGRIE